MRPILKPSEEERARQLIEGICKHLGYEIRDNRHSNFRWVSICHGDVEILWTPCTGDILQYSFPFQKILYQHRDKKHISGMNPNILYPWVEYSGNTVTEIDLNMTLRGNNFSGN